MQHLTKEQLEIIKSNKNKIRINALAGYGKTYTLIQKCISHIKESKENKKILYIVFDKNIKEAIQKDFQRQFKKKFSKYKSKSMLSCIQVKTTYELALDLLSNQIGHFKITEFDASDIQAFLNLSTSNKYSNEDAKTINKKLHDYYNSPTSITKLLQNELKEQFGDEETQKIAYIYEGVISIINAQMKLLFHINKDSCLKLATSIDTQDTYYDIAIIDEAQDTNAFIFKIFLDIKSNIKILSGDTFSHIFLKEKSTNKFDAIEGFIDYKLTKSMRLSKRACEHTNKVLYKLSKKIKMVGENTNFEENLIEINKKKPTYIYLNNANMLNDIYKSVLEQKTIHIIGDFTNQYKEFLAMCYIQSDFDEEFLKIHKELKTISKKFLKFKTLSNYIELTKNATYKDYYFLIQKWQKSQDNLLGRIKSIQSSHTDKTSQADISYALVNNTKAREFNYVVLANDFINHTKIQKPNEKETQELHLLYTAITRCKLGLYRRSLS